MTATHHPGEVLAHKLESLGVTPTELARQLHVPANNGQRAITGTRRYGWPTGLETAPSSG